MADVRNTTIEVDIVTPEGIELSFRPADVPKGVQGDLLHVHTHNDMNEACGTFILTFSGRAINGLTYDELIPLRSEVTIRLQDARWPVSAKDSVVMRGLTDDHGVQEHYSARVPQRVVTISGRSGAGLLLDARLFYHPLLEHDPHLGTLRKLEGNFLLFWQERKLVGYELDPRRALGVILAYYLGLPGTTSLGDGASGVPARPPVAHPAPTPAPPPRPPATSVLPTDEADALGDQETLQMMMTRDPRLSLAQAQTRLAHLKALRTEHGEMSPPQARRRPGPIRRTPAAAMAAAPPPPQASPTPPQPPTTSNQLLNLELPGQRTVADLLVYRESEATLFTPGVTLFLGHDVPAAGALWNYLQIFVDTLMQELFSRIEDGTCRLHFRGKPFLKEFSGTGSRFVDNEPTLATIEVPWREVLARQQRRQTSQIYNFFLVMPAGAALMRDDPYFRLSLAPTILRQPDDPGAVQRYGIRVMEHVSPYLSATRILPTSEGKKLSTSPLASKDKTVQTAIEWSQWASVWYGAGSEMYTGFLQLPGSPRYNCGQRLTWDEPRGTREAYCEGVDHDWDARTGLYTTQLRYTRAWYLSGPVDQRRKASTNGGVSTLAGSGSAEARG